MTMRGWLPVLLAVFAIGCAAETSGPKEDTTPPADVGMDDLRAPSPDKPEPLATETQHDDVVDQARADRLVGEEATGYLAIVTDENITGAKKGPSDLETRVQKINDQRRAAYADLASKDGVTVDEAAQTTACVLFREKGKVGEAYHTDDQAWKVRTFDVPVHMPSFCATP